MRIQIRLIAILILLILLCECQRGGGRSSGSRSRSSSRSSWGRSRSSWGRSRSRSGSGSIFSYFFPSNNQTIQNATTTTAGEQQDESSQSSSWQWVVGGLSVFGILAYIGNNANKQKQKQRRNKIEQMFTMYEGQCQANMCTLNDVQKQQLRDWVMSTKWNIHFQTNNRSFNDTAEITMTDIKSKSHSSYKFSMKIYDSIGESKVEGVLVHQFDHFGIMFQKTYNDRSNAGQTGSFDLLVYEGVQQGNMFRGQWYYKGYETNSQYSGTWEMFPSK